MATTAVEGLATAVRGRVVEAGAPGYDEARALYNAMIDKRPAAIAYCVDEKDVAAAIAFAREHGLRLAIRGGGHNGGGLGSVDDGLVIDLSMMNEISVDPAARMVRVQGGAPLGTFDARRTSTAVRSRRRDLDDRRRRADARRRPRTPDARVRADDRQPRSQRRSSSPTARSSRPTRSASPISSGRSAAAAATSASSRRSRSACTP